MFDNIYSKTNYESKGIRDIWKQNRITQKEILKERNIKIANEIITNNNQNIISNIQENNEDSLKNIISVKTPWRVIKQYALQSNAKPKVFKNEKNKLELGDYLLNLALEKAISNVKSATNLNNKYIEDVIFNYLKKNQKVQLNSYDTVVFLSYITPSWFQTCDNCGFDENEPQWDTCVSCGTENSNGDSY